MDLKHAYICDNIYKFMSYYINNSNNGASTAAAATAATTFLR